MKLFLKIAALSAVVVCVALTSCTTDCYESKRTLLGVAFIDSLSLKPITIQRLTVKGAGSDSVLYNNVSVSTIYLPMHITQELTEYEFAIAPETEEEEMVFFTLSVNHTTRPFFVSKECGCIASHEVFEVCYTPNKLVKSIDIYNSSVLNVENDIHIKIYF